MANIMFFGTQILAEKVGRAQNRFLEKNLKKIWKFHPEYWKPNRSGTKSYAEFGYQLILGSHMRPKSSKTVKIGTQIGAQNRDPKLAPKPLCFTANMKKATSSSRRNESKVKKTL